MTQKQRQEIRDTYKIYKKMKRRGLAQMYVISYDDSPELGTMSKKIMIDSLMIANFGREAVSEAFKPTDWKERKKEGRRLIEEYFAGRIHDNTVRVYPKTSHTPERYVVQVKNYLLEFQISNTGKIRYHGESIISS